jgi:hypothetical protein
MKDIQNIFSDESIQQQAYWESKYESSREAFNSYGNFHFLFQLDEGNAKKFLDYVGFTDPQNSSRFVTSEIAAAALPEGK